MIGPCYLGSVETELSPTRLLSRHVYPEFARVGMALASDKRLMMLELLAQGPRSVDALATAIGLSMANTSQHLQVLRNAKLVESDRDGNRVIYWLTDGSALRLWLSLRSFAAEHLPEVEQLKRKYAVAGAGGEEMPRDLLADALMAGDVFILDVRPAIEFQHGHLPGASTVPLASLLDHIDELPRDKRIVAYCRGAYCLEADEAVALLRQHGFDAVRLEGGWPEWLMEQRQIETGQARGD